MTFKFGAGRGSDTKGAGARNTRPTSLVTWQTDALGQLLPRGYVPDGMGGLAGVYRPKDAAGASATAGAPVRDDATAGSGGRSGPATRSHSTP